MELLHVFQCVHFLPLPIADGCQVLFMLALRERDRVSFDIPFKANECGAHSERDILGGLPDEAQGIRDVINILEAISEGCIDRGLGSG